MKRILPGKRFRYAAAAGVKVGAFGIHPAERASFRFMGPADATYNGSIPKGVLETVRGAKDGTEACFSGKERENREKTTATRNSTGRREEIKALY